MDMVYVGGIGGATHKPCRWRRLRPNSNKTEQRNGREIDANKYIPKQIIEMRNA